MTAIRTTRTRAREGDTVALRMRGWVRANRLELFMLCAGGVFLSVAAVFGLALGV